jgi:GT2 family glycosyltransferase
MKTIGVELDGMTTVIVLFGAQHSLTYEYLQEVPGECLIVVANGDEACRWLTDHKAMLAIQRKVITVVQPSNPGLAVAYNVALASCSTEWLLLLDQDSKLYPGSVGELLRAAHAAPDRVAVVTGIIIDEGTQRTTNRTVEKNRHLSAQDPFVLVHPMHFQNSGSLYRTSAMQHVGGWSPQFRVDLVDAELAVRLDRNGWQQGHVDLPILQHNLGAITAHERFGLTFHATHHSVERRHENGRALGTLIRTHGIRSVIVRRTVRHVAGNLAGIVFAERQRPRKLLNFAIGFVQGLSTTLQRNGRLDE